MNTKANNPVGTGGWPAQNQNRPHHVWGMGIGDTICAVNCSSPTVCRMYLLDWVDFMSSFIIVLSLVASNLNGQVGKVFINDHVHKMWLLMKTI